jgi:cholesterol transport system auxiliary component
MLLVASCAASLAGCSVFPSPRAPQIYHLTPVASASPQRRILRRRLVVVIPTASESLDTDRIALIRDRVRFDYYANSLWTDRVPLLVQTLLVDAFENDGSIAEVGRDAQALTPDYLLETEVRRFEAVYSGATDEAPTVVVLLDLGLVEMPSHRRVGHTLLSEQSPASHNSVDSVVEAFDVAVGNILLQSVAWTIRVMSRAP